MNSEQVKTKCYSLSQYYTDEVPKYPQLVLATKIREKTLELYGKIYPENIDAKKDDRLLIAIYERLTDGLNESIKSNVTYDTCFSALISNKKKSLNYNSLYSNFTNLTKELISHRTVSDSPDFTCYKKAVIELQKMGFLKNKT